MDFLRYIQNGEEYKGTMVDPSEQAIFNVINFRNRNKQWVDRGLNPGAYPVHNQEDFMDDDKKQSHLLGWGETDNGGTAVFPTVTYSDGQLSRKKGEPIYFPEGQRKLAEAYSKNGLIRHQYGGMRGNHDGIYYDEYQKGGEKRNSLGSTIDWNKYIKMSPLQQIKYVKSLEQKAKQKTPKRKSSKRKNILPTQNSRPIIDNNQERDLNNKVLKNNLFNTDYNKRTTKTLSKIAKDIEGNTLSYLDASSWGVHTPEAKSLLRKVLVKRALEFVRNNGMPEIKYPANTSNFLNIASSKGIDNYNPYTNTINLFDPGSLLPELSHSYQQKVLKESLPNRVIKDWLADPFLSRKGQVRQYSREGSLEHDAHSVVEPKLTDSYNKYLEDGIPYSFYDELIDYDEIMHKLNNNILSSKKKTLNERLKDKMFDDYIASLQKNKHQTGGMIGNYDGIYYDEYGNKMYKGKRVFSPQGHKRYVQGLNNRPHTGFSYNSPQEPAPLPYKTHKGKRVFSSMDEARQHYASLNAKPNTGFSYNPPQEPTPPPYRTHNGKRVFSSMNDANQHYANLNAQPNTGTSYKLPKKLSTQEELKRRYLEQQRSLGKLKKGGYINKTGYTDGEPTNNNPFNIIDTPTGEITMENTSKNLIGIDETGYKRYMRPGGRYSFPGRYVLEIPV